jgi:hypothetical protein
LDQFLDGESSEGRIDSTGHFTFNATKAFEKQGEFAFSLPGGLALKLLQGAVAAGAQTLEVKIERQWIEFNFGHTMRTVELPKKGENEQLFGITKGMWKAKLVEASFLSPDASNQSPGLKDFCLGLRALAQRPNGNFRLSLEGSPWDLIWESGELRKEKNSRYDLKTVLRFTQDTKNRVAASADIHNALTRFGYLAPLDLKLDGRRLDRLQNCPRHGTHPERSLIAGGYFHPQGRLVNPFRIPSGTFDESLGHLKLTNNSIVALGEEMAWPEPRAPKDIVAAWLLTAHLHTKDSENDSELVWSRYGVEVRRESLGLRKRRVSLCVYASADGLQTDLGGLALVENESLDQARSKVRQCLSLEPEYPAVTISPRLRAAHSSVLESVTATINKWWGKSLSLGRDWDALEVELNEDIKGLATELRSF